MTATDVLSSGGAQAQLALIDLAEALDRAAVTATDPNSRHASLRWVWVALVGVMAVAGAAGFAYCKSNGYDGFTGNVDLLRNGEGVQIGVKVGCY
jgi:hypothetical protein